MSRQAVELLGGLLDRAARHTGPKPVGGRPPALFDGAAERAEFGRVLASAETAGAVRVVHGKGDLRHLVRRVVLVDADRLCAFLGRTPLASAADRAVAVLEAAVPGAHSRTVEVLDALAGAWRQGRACMGMALGDPRASGLLVSLDAVLCRDPGDARDLRTFSRMATGSSKTIEGHRDRIASLFRQWNLLPLDTPDGRAFEILGLEKFAQPVLVAGPIMASGTDVSGLPYVGLPPEALEDWHPIGRIRSVLTVENLASFNRHVREARRDGDIVIYTGGFPSRAVSRAIRSAMSWCPDGCWHWGDVDPAGIRIALHVARQGGVDLRPHLMSPELAQAHGTPSAPVSEVLGLGTRFEALGRFLASQGACHMEQEESDPRPLLDRS